MMTKEKLESYRHLFTTSEDDTADDIIDSHLEALEEIRVLKKEQREECNKMEITAKCPKCHSELERITSEGLDERVIRCICKKCNQTVEVSIGEPYLPAT